MLDVLKDAVRTTVPPALARVESAFQRGDARDLREAAHSLLGMVATVSSSAGSAASVVEDAAAEGAARARGRPARTAPGSDPVHPGGHRRRHAGAIGATGGPARQGLG